MKCPYCGAEVTGRFCSYCGSELPQEKPNIHIEHKETIINNYDSNKEPDYDRIYEEERMRQDAKDRILQEKLEEQRKIETQGCLVKVIIFLLFVGFIWYKVSMWWSGLFDDGVKPMKIGSEEYNEIINIDDNNYWADNADENDEDKWYRVTCLIDSNSDSSIDSVEYGSSGKYFYFSMEDNIELGEMGENTQVTVVGYLRTTGSGRLYFSHCILNNN